MTVSLLPPVGQFLGAAAPANYIGLAADTKPAGAPVGSTYLAVDTGAMSIYDGTAWQAGAGGARASLYGKNATAGDTALVSSPAGALNAFVTATVGGADADSNTLAYPKSSADQINKLGIASHLSNGVTWDRQRNNMEVTVLASAARTTLQDSADLVNYNARGVVICVDITVYTAGNLTITVQEKSTLSGKYNTILTSAALAAAATTFLTIYPGVTVAANVAVSAPLTRIFKVHVAVGDATSITYSIDANFIL